MYEWENKAVEESEVVSLLKTSKDNWKNVKKEVRRLHSYETPCIIKLSVEANSDYEEWVKSCLR
ncbi:divalent-cation tolerance protein CutA [Candidatus Woesearchaeota archaeon]|nr:divalent-cation tolerance protein CutA [Candidatus Woesearchaeota archaeon]